jgi:hypothetical protein
MRHESPQELEDIASIHFPQTGRSEGFSGASFAKSFSPSYSSSLTSPARSDEKNSSALEFS